MTQPPSSDQPIPSPPGDPGARRRIDTRAMRRSAKAAHPAPLHTASLSKSKSTERVRLTLVMFTGVGSFGAAVAMSAYYTAATADDPVISTFLLAWSFVAYLGTGILALIWQMGNTLYPTIGRYARYFSASGAAVFASYSCILAGTFLLAVALAMSSEVPVSMAGIVLICAILLPVAFVSQWYQIRARQRKRWGVPTSPNVISQFWKTMLPNFYDERFVNQAFAWNDDPTRLFASKDYAALQRTAETMATMASGRDIAKFLLLGVRFASPVEYVLATAPEDEDGTLDVNEMAERIVYASRAFHATRDVPDTVTDVEQEACSEFLRLSETYGPLVSQLSAIDPNFWDSPLEDRTRQVYFLHKASGCATAEDSDAAVHSAIAAEAPHVIVQMGEETAGAGNAVEGSTSDDAGLTLRAPSALPCPPTAAEASGSGHQEDQQVASAASNSNTAGFTGADIELARLTSIRPLGRSVGDIDQLDEI